MLKLHHDQVHWFYLTIWFNLRVDATDAFTAFRYYAKLPRGEYYFHGRLIPTVAPEMYF